MLMVTWSDAPSEITDAQAVSRRGSIGTRLCHVGVPCNLDSGQGTQKNECPCMYLTDFLHFFVPGFFKII